MVEPVDTADIERGIVWGPLVSGEIVGMIDTGDQDITDGQVLDTIEEGFEDGEFTIDVSGNGADADIYKGELVFTSSGAGWGNLGGYSQAVVRTTGRTFFSNIQNVWATNIVAIGWESDCKQ